MGENNNNPKPVLSFCAAVQDLNTLENIHKLTTFNRYNHFHELSRRNWVRAKKHIAHLKDKSGYIYIDLLTYTPFEKEVLGYIANKMSGEIDGLPEEG